MLQGRLNPSGAVLEAPPPGRLRKAFLAAECLLLFGGIPATLAWNLSRGVFISPLAVIAVMLAFVLWVLFRDPSFDRSVFRWPRGAVRVRMRVIRWVIAAALLAGLLAFLAPEKLFSLPRARPGLWLLICLLYPLLSVLPQGVLYRVYFHHRYAPLFGAGTTMALMASIFFSWAHIVFLNLPALAVTAVGGWFFARTYQESRSLPASCVEHAAYGDLLFTLGYGQYLYLGTQAVVQKWLGG